MMKRVLGLSVIVALGIFLATAGVASAIPLIEGESKLANATGTGFIRVDWQVFSPGVAGPLGITAGLFQYVYQLEATVSTTDSGSPNDISSFTIALPTGISFVTWSDVAGNIVFGGETNPNVGGNPALSCCVAPAIMQQNPGVANALFGPVIPQSGQSDRLVGTSPLPPAFGNGTAVDGAPGSPWASTHPTGQQIPIPTPEPATLVLLGIATGLAGLVIRKRK